MKLICHLRTLRGDRRLADVSAEAGVPIGQLSQIERGHLLPRDEWVPRLAAAYASEPADWYPANALRAISEDA